MTILTKIHKGICTAALTAALVLALPSCVWEDMPEGGGGTVGKGQGVHLSLTVMSSSTTSVSRANHGDDFEEQGSDIENYIDFDNDDFRIVIFDKSGDYLVEPDLSSEQWKIYPKYQSGDYVMYYLEGDVELPESITATDIERISKEGVQVIALANWKGADSRASYTDIFKKGTGRQTLAEIWKDAANYNFGYTPQAGNMTWMPALEPARRLIPMFGFAASTAFEARYNNGVLYAGATIPMQRAMAKIEVIDNLTDQPQLSIGDVTMTDFNTTGRFIPDIDANKDWSKIGSQVDRSSVPAGVQKQTGLKFFKVTEDGVNKWIAYVPEMELEKGVVSGAGEVSETRTHLKVDIASTMASFTGATYPLHFARYDEVTSMPTFPDDSWNHILRNHIYRFYVNKVGISVKLHLHVLNWNLDDDEEWDFTDHVSVSKQLEWKNDTYADFTPSTGEVLLSFDKPYLEGEFEFITPQNATWYARLVPIGDAKPGAVTFVDADGKPMNPTVGSDPEYCPEISGIIGHSSDGVIRIRPTSSAGDIESRFRLEFLVENLGVWITVPMPPDEPNYYTIIRPANIIDFSAR
ncbi:MAG: hypothetical protein J1F05_04470 [Muribaculaceae bacterium]|nr:hypothetical protein [Muribaculaceae bacterium]